jgi:hypothetical protein
MTIRKMMAGSALAVGLGVAAMIGAGTADARPGISFDRGSGDPVQFGDNDPKTGAVASASDGNRALAISLYKPAMATANGEGTGNRVVAINGGTATVTGDASGNTLVAVGGGSAKASNDNNSIVALGSDVNAANESAQRVVALCGKSIVRAQSDNVTVSAGACGPSAN